MSDAPIRVLLADDQRVVREGLSMLVGLLPGIEVVGTAADGEEGLALVARLRPDVVLLDIMLPKRNGYDVCRAIKSDPVLAATPVIMLTARGQEVEVLKGRELGAAAYVTKPFGNAEILEAVRAALGPRA